MTTKLIAENILDSDDFLSATEQEGEYVGQPTPDSGNTGAFRLLSKGDIEDFIYRGTATGDGAGGGTTVVDAILKAFGDDYFIGGNVTINGYGHDTGDFTAGGADVARIALTDAETITVTDLDKDEEAWCYVDKGAGQISGDFEARVQFNCTDDNGMSDACSPFAVTNSIGTLCDIDTASGDYIGVYWLQHGLHSGNGAFFLEEVNAGAINNDYTEDLPTNIEYYLKIIRDESVGTYGTIYCYVYTGGFDGTLVDKLTVTLTEKQDFRYLFWMNSYESGGFGGAAFDGTIKDLIFRNGSAESKAVSDFAQSTGTLTTAALAEQVTDNSDFTLTLSFADRDFRVELIAGGDAGAATFKWSHDGGTTYFGRDDPIQATYLDSKVIATTTATQRTVLLQMSNGSLLCAYYDNANSKICCKISADLGLTWGSEIDVDTTGFPYLGGGCVLSSGRILLSHDNVSGGSIAYSDDNGATWTAVKGAYSTSKGGQIAQLISGDVVVAVSDTTASTTIFHRSTDGGFTWSAPVTVSSDGQSASAYCGICEMPNGNLLIVHADDSDSAGDFELKGFISTDNGATWGAAIDVFDFDATDNTDATLFVDINDRIYCFFDHSNNIKFVYSDDNGATWSAAVAAKSTTSTGPWPVLVDGHEIICSYVEGVSNDVGIMRRGVWEAYSGNACPAATRAVEQKLVCEAGIVWHGGAGVAGDKWTFVPEYQYAMANIISDSPSKPWRSEQDDIACAIVLDMGANERFRATGVAFFGANIRALDFQMHTADSWGTPDVDEAVSFQLATGAVDADDGNMIQDTSLLADYKDHELKNMILRMTSGSLDDTAWKIKDNVGNYIILDTTADVSAIAASDTFEILQSAIFATFTGGNKRFLRISIAAHNTPDGYYEIGAMVAGEAISLTREWKPGYKKTHAYDVEMLRTPHGGMVPVKGADRKRLFEVAWNANQTTREEVTALADYLDGKNIAMVPNHATLTDCYLVKQIGDIAQAHWAKTNLFSFGLKFEEVL